MRKIIFLVFVLLPTLIMCHIIEGCGNSKNINGDKIIIHGKLKNTNGEKIMLLQSKG